MNKKFFNTVNMLLFVTGVVLGVLKLVGVEEISWWLVVALTVGPWILFAIFLVLVVGEAVVASKVDINPDSHLKEDSLKIVYNGKEITFDELNKLLELKSRQNQ